MLRLTSLSLVAAAWLIAGFASGDPATADGVRQLRARPAIVASVQGPVAVLRGSHRPALEPRMIRVASLRGRPAWQRQGRRERKPRAISMAAEVAAASKRSVLKAARSS